MPKEKAPVNRLTTELLEREGWVYDKAEYTMRHCFITKDLFGGIDFVALKEGRTLGIQATTVSNQAARRTKLLGLPNLLAWILAGNELEVWGWVKTDNRWRVVRTPIVAWDYEIRKAAA